MKNSNYLFLQNRFRVNKIRNMDGVLPLLASHTHKPTDQSLLILKYDGVFMANHTVWFSMKMKNIYFLVEITIKYPQRQQTIYHIFLMDTFSF